MPASDEKSPVFSKTGVLKLAQPERERNGTSAAEGPIARRQFAAEAGESKNPLWENSGPAR